LKDSTKIRTKWKIHLLKETALNTIFPRSCPVCAEVVHGKNGFICPECVKMLTVIREPMCEKCGRPLVSTQQEYCEECQMEKHVYRRAFSMYKYNDAMKQSIYQFKYKKRYEYAFYYGWQMTRKIGAERLYASYDAIVPVPLHKKRRKMRGYNQAECLAKEISLRTGLPLAAKLLIRSKATAPMKELSKAERRKNLQNAFAVQGNKVPERILLIDDIYTTGATADACAKVLMKHGAKLVDCYCLAMEDGR